MSKKCAYKLGMFLRHNLTFWEIHSVIERLIPLLHVRHTKKNPRSRRKQPS